MSDEKIEKKGLNENITEQRSKIVTFFKERILERFTLGDDAASQKEINSNIQKGIMIRGTNLWVLIFAIFIASLGLNTNSTAVIIGAMLISPLMGPIIGMGYSMGVYDFALLKESFRNFLIMIVVSLVTSAVFFTLPLISSTQSELLARTQPTTYDILIALFGGLAGMVAQTRKDRTGTVIPGVAIATALMPPLCTVGYGLATFQFRFMLGALYARLPLKRPPAVSDFTAAVLFLAWNRSITGAILPVDCGQSLLYGEEEI